VQEFKEYGVKTSFDIKDKSVVNKNSKQVVFRDEVEIPKG